MPQKKAASGKHFGVTHRLLCNEKAPTVENLPDPALLEYPKHFRDKVQEHQSWKTFC